MSSRPDEESRCCASRTTNDLSEETDRHHFGVFDPARALVVADRQTYLSYDHPKARFDRITIILPRLKVAHQREIDRRKELKSVLPQTIQTKS